MVKALRRQRVQHTVFTGKCTVLGFDPKDRGDHRWRHAVLRLRARQPGPVLRQKTRAVLQIGVVYMDDPIHVPAQGSFLGLLFAFNQLGNFLRCA